MPLQRPKSKRIYDAPRITVKPFYHSTIHRVMRDVFSGGGPTYGSPGRDFPKIAHHFYGGYGVLHHPSPGRDERNFRYEPILQSTAEISAPFLSLSGLGRAHSIPPVALTRF